jgi:hypothetical protein
VSDNWIRLIPTDPNWQPEPTAVEDAIAFVRGLFSTANASADEVSWTLHERIAFIDSGVNTASVKCSLCGAVTDVEWVFEVVSERADDLGNLDTAMPCCGARANLNELRYDWPMGFARFEIEVMNGTRAQYELDAVELEQLGALLGHPVRQVLQHI